MDLSPQNLIARWFLVATDIDHAFVQLIQVKLMVTTVKNAEAYFLEEVLCNCLNFISMVMKRSVTFTLHYPKSRFRLPMFNNQCRLFTVVNQVRHFTEK